MKIREGENEEIDLRLNDVVNEVWYLFYALTTFFAPNIGTWLYEIYDWRLTCDIVAILNLGVALILFFFNCGPQVFREDQRFKENLS